MANYAIEIKNLIANVEGEMLVAWRWWPDHVIYNEIIYAKMAFEERKLHRPLLPTFQLAPTTSTVDINEYPCNKLVFLPCYLL